MTIGANYISETMVDVSGGVRRGSIYEGELALAIDLDLEKLAGFQGATAHVGGLQLHGRGPSADLVRNLMDVSNIEAEPSTRLDTLWLQQDLFKGGLSIRAGEIRADDDFLISPTASDLLNGTFAWASIASANMTNGGPAFPLAAPGLRARATPAHDFSILAAVFSGDPAGSHCRNDPQACNDDGTTFSFSSGALWMGELQYTSGNRRRLVPGVYKLGGWYETGSFAVGGSKHSGDFGIYAIADSTLWRGLGASSRGLNAFLRLGWSPPDRNLVSLYIDGGFAYEGLIPNRDEDRIVLGVAYAKVSPDAFEVDWATSANAFNRTSDYECVMELSYVLHVAPWLTVQPDLQYVMPYNPAETIGKALVLGMRTRILF
jgi:porin